MEYLGNLTEAIRMTLQTSSFLHPSHQTTAHSYPYGSAYWADWYSFPDPGASIMLMVHGHG